MAFIAGDAVQLIRYDLDALDPSKAGSSRYIPDQWQVDTSWMYGGYLLADYTISGSKPSHTVIRAAGTQQSISALDDIGEKEITLPMVFIPTNKDLSGVSAWVQITQNISKFTKLLMNDGEPVRIALRGTTSLQFVGRLTDVSEVENTIYDGTERAVTFTLTGYLTQGIQSTYHTAYTGQRVEGNADKIMACIDFKKSASTAGVWILGTRITGLTDYVYLRFDGINKKILGAKAPASGAALTWENIMQKIEPTSFSGFPYLRGGESYLIGDLPAVGLSKNGSSTTYGVSTAYTIYDAILI